MNVTKINTLAAQSLNCQPLRVIKNTDDAPVGKKLDVVCDKARANGNLGQRLSLLA